MFFNIVESKKRLSRYVVFAGIVLLSIFAISSCGSKSINNEQSQKIVESNIGTNGKLVPIQSDNVFAAGYDDVSLTMTVAFKNGARYEYYGVPSDLWTSFLAAQPHPWTQVGFPRLVQGGYPYVRIA